jgi:hypothetical protein
MTTNQKEKPAENESVIELASSMIADARTRIEAEHRDAPRHGAVSTIALVLAVLSVLAAGVTTIYGIGWLPGDIPIRQSGDGFVGKTGKAHSRAEFEAYTTWSTAMFVTYPATFALWFLYAAVRKRDRRVR